MPLYEYECAQCGERFEKIQKFSDPPVDTCPKCGGGPVRKLISSPAIQFKGAGWYITDYARKGSKDTKEATDTKEGKDTKEAKETKDTKDTATSDSSSKTPPKESSSS